jgi:hypothetical protein
MNKQAKYFLIMNLIENMIIFDKSKISIEYILRIK